ncbi:hypothetical protein H312_00042, partial [Anncaliia algerae PRA339]
MIDLKCNAIEVKKEVDIIDLEIENVENDTNFVMNDKEVISLEYDSDQSTVIFEPEMEQQSDSGIEKNNSLVSQEST